MLNALDYYYIILNWSLHQLFHIHIFLVKLTLYELHPNNSTLSIMLGMV